MEKINRLGEKHTTNEGYEVEIIEYFSAINCTVVINDEKGTVLRNIQYSKIKAGSVRNPNHNSVYGIGYMGQGNYKSKYEGVSNKSYKTWLNIFVRLYSKNKLIKNPTYKDVTICEEWHNFQNFAKWFQDNYKPETMDGWHLDKDILIKGNKVYSPETCCFVPYEINVLFTKRQHNRGDYPIGVFYKTKNKKFSTKVTKGNTICGYLGLFDTPKEAFEAYKTAKEAYIKEVADKWKDLIDLKVYQALYAYQVEITD